MFADITKAKKRQYRIDCWLHQFIWVPKKFMKEDFEYVWMLLKNIINKLWKWSSSVIDTVDSDEIQEWDWTCKSKRIKQTLSSLKSLMSCGSARRGLNAVIYPPCINQNEKKRIWKIKSSSHSTTFSSLIFSPYFTSCGCTSPKMLTLSFPLTERRGDVWKASRAKGVHHGSFGAIVAQFCGWWIATGTSAVSQPWSCPQRVWTVFSRSSCLPLT